MAFKATVVNLEVKKPAGKWAPRCFEWVVTISYWQPEVELSGDEIDHGFEVTG